MQFRQVCLQQSIQPVKEGLLLYDGIWVFVPCVDGFPEKFRHFSRPFLLGVQLAKVLEFTQQVGQADLVAKEVEHEVCAVPVGHGDYPLQCVSKAFLQDLGAAPARTEQRREVNGLGYPYPIQPLIAVAASLVEAHDKGILKVFLNGLYGGSGVLLGRLVSICQLSLG